jgi:signal peptidase I
MLRKTVMPAERTAGKPARIVGALIRTLSLTGLVVAVLAALALIVVPRVTGSYTYTVLTSSMAPHYPPGTFVVVKPAPFETLRTGDVITYQLESGRPDVVTHRITAVSSTQQGERTFITKGDNNTLEDEKPVLEVQVRGKLFYAVPYAGFLATAAGHSERNTVLQIAAIVLIGYGIFTCTRGVITGKKRRRNPAAAEGADPARAGTPA